MKDEINNLQEYPLVTCLCSALVTYIPATNETYFQKNTCIGIEKNCDCGYGGSASNIFNIFLPQKAHYRFDLKYFFL